MGTANWHIDVLLSGRTYVQCKKGSFDTVKTVYVSI